MNLDSEVDSAGSKSTESNNTPRSGRINLAGPFKARTNGFHEKSVAAATVESGVAAATHYSPDDPFPALKGWAKFIRPLRGQLRNRGLTEMVVVAVISISSVALIVAGIVAMNRMLVSVTECTREIGTSGAFGSSIRMPFGYAMMALSAAAFIGIGAGIFPAHINSRMPPVEALRAES